MKYLWVLASILFSILAQINLKSTSHQLPTTIDGYLNGNFFLTAWLFFRALFFSGLSLLVTWYSYKSFEFLEFVVAQAAFYIFAMGIGYYFFNEPLTIGKVIGVCLIILGIISFNINLQSL